MNESPVRFGCVMPHLAHRHGVERAENSLIRILAKWVCNRCNEHVTIKWWQQYEEWIWTLSHFVCVCVWVCVDNWMSNQRIPPTPQPQQKLSTNFNKLYSKWLYVRVNLGVFISSNIPQSPLGYSRRTIKISGVVFRRVFYTNDP